MKNACPFAAQWRPELAGGTTTPPTCPLGFRPDNGSSSSPAAAAAITCPLGFGGGTNSANKRPTTASFANSGLPRMPLAVLAGHPTLVSVKGVVFDVSGDEAYQEAAGGTLAAWAGHDASRLLAVSTGGCDDGDNVGGGLNEGLEGLRYEEHQRLEAYFLEVARVRRAVAVLTDEDHMWLVKLTVFVSEAF